MYLAVVLDLFSRKMVGWQLSDSLETALILVTLNRAVILRQVTPSIDLLLHSDQGCQYTSHAYQDRLAELGVHFYNHERSIPLLVWFHPSNTNKYF